MKVRLLVNILGLLLPLACLGADTSGLCLQQVADSLRKKLPFATTATDSMRILSDLFDAVPRDKRDSVGVLAYEAAMRAGNETVALDMLRNLANIHFRNDSLLILDLERAMLFPESDSRSETITFIRMLHNMYQVRYATPEERDAELHRLLAEVNNVRKQDVYEQIATLHALCLYIGECSQGELLSAYMQKLGDLVESVPDAYSVRNCFYVQAAIVYTQNEEFSKAVEADRHLLECIDKLESGEQGFARKFRNYDGNRYVIYTRLLANYPILTDEEVETYYREAMRMVERNELSRQTNSVSGRPQIFYAMFSKNYAEALDLIGKYGAMPYNANIRRQILRMTIECAEAVGDKEALLDASREYNSLLEKVLDDRMVEKYKEYEIVYDIHRLKAEHSRATLMMQHRQLLMAVVCAVVLLVLLVVVAVLWRRSRGLARRNAAVSDELRAERDNLRLSQNELMKARDEARQASRIKSDFIKNMSSEVSVPLHTINEYTNLIIDCSEAGMKSYLRHFADMVAQSADVLTTIVNDVLNLSEIDSDSLHVEKKPSQLRYLCEIAADSVKHRVKSGVSLKVAEGLPDVSVVTDPQRILQVLVQLLKNAAKFTTEGSIEIGFKVDDGNDRVEIYVSDSGPGIPPDFSERIFERFVKLDSNSSGIGIGLSVARLVTERLGGVLELDTDYTGGARFVITLPVI
ncbi:MAG: HAMP domain-containing histidine kinase [Muribaculaceae bacterium]|nr:HAMP domain-containing histidine kinase [Muribaculaceae bacterium]